MKEKVAYKEGKFVDFSGTERPFVIAAVSVEDKDSIMASGIELLDINEKDGIGSIYFLDKGVYFGIAVLHPSDLGTKPVTKEGKEVQVPIYDVEVGKIIAKNKAVNPDSCINFVLGYNAGILSSEVIQAMLDQEARYFSSNPSRYLAGYEKARVKYNFENLGGSEKEIELKAKKAEIETLEKSIENLRLKARKTKN